MIESSLFLSPYDLRSGDLDRELSRIAELGVTAIAPSFAYHQARDVTPHGPHKVVIRRDGLYFTPPDDMFNASGMVPPLAAEQPLDTGALTAACGAAGLELHGWAVFAHNMTLGQKHLELTQRNCFDDQAAPSDLCVSHPRVQQYCLDLAAAIARLGVTSIFAESLHFGTFSHGYHHERSFVQLGRLGSFLLGLCFCAHCKGAASSSCEPEKAQWQARAYLESIFSGIRKASSDPALDLSDSENDLSEVRRYALQRSAQVSALTGRLADELGQSGVRCVFMDATGASQGYANGRFSQRLVESSWEIGVDPAATSQCADFQLLAYTSSVDVIAQTVADYRSLVGQGAQLRVVMRPGTPDTADEHHLTDKVHAAIDAGADAVDFYHYGLCTLADLDRIPFALSRSRSIR